MDTPNKTLKEVLDALINLQVIPPSRMGPIKTAVKQYAIILGYDDPDQCPINAYHLPDARRNRLIEEKAQGSRRGEFAPSGLGRHAIRNLKNNVSYVIRSTVERKVISQLPGPLASSKDSNSITKYIITRRESVTPTKYIIDPVPHSLVREITAYETWSTRIVNRDRPDSLRKRPITFVEHRATILRASGYLVKNRGLPARIDHAVNAYRTGECHQLHRLVC